MKLSDRIVDSMIDNNIIEKDDIDIYRYAVSLLSETVLSFTVFLIIAAFLGIVKEMLVFLTAFAILRQYAGGSHSGSFIGCFVISCLFSSSLYLPLKFTGDGTVFVIIGSALSLPVIAVLSPVDSVYKPIEENDRKLYKKRLLILLFIEVIAAIAAAFCVNIVYSVCIVYSWCLLALSLTAGRIQNKILKR